MRSIKRSLRVCGSLLKYLFTSPAPYMAALALILFLWDRSFELGRIARQYRLSIHAGGYFSVLVNHSLSLIMLNHYMWYTLTVLLYVVLLLFATKCYTFTNYKCHAKLAYWIFSFVVHFINNYIF